MTLRPLENHITTVHNCYRETGGEAELHHPFHEGVDARGGCGGLRGEVRGSDHRGEREKENESRQHSDSTVRGT